MKSIIGITLFFFVLVANIDAQIDTSFYMPKYPTGHDGFVRDIAAFANITQEEKDSLIDDEIEITLLILADGSVEDSYAKGPFSSNLLRRIEAASMKLHDFVPAQKNGKSIKGTYNTTMSYYRYYPQDMVVQDMSRYEEKGIGWSLDYGGYIGNFAGNITDVYGLNGGLHVGMGAVFDNSLINFDFGIGGAKKSGSFILPPEVISESNNAHFFYGASYSRFFKVKDNHSFRTKLGIGGYSINAGIVSESNLYRLAGLDIYSELAYAFKVGENTSHSYYRMARFKHYVTPFVQLHSWSGDQQSKGLFFNLGVRYSLEIIGMKLK